MKVFIVEYNSPNNLFKGIKIVEASNIVEAQNKFLFWLRNQNVYQHMWELSFKFLHDDHKPFETI